ncbi:glycosyltransferase [Picosynechococcus sp. NKBG042902]|uniref:glycosyltransferase n=1 Tax=Picosynechococcus sp. NKBG042902 TaxID=490193 RepID=UPI001CB7A084|nr:glycosyltransferase [Picosynechococcus sp. NKBG042902]
MPAVIKVLHVLPSLSLKLGGPTQVALNLVSALRKVGIDAEIATTNDDQDTVLDVPLGQRVIYHNVPVYFFPRFPIRMKEFLFSTELTRWLWQHQKNYDLVETHYLFSYASSCSAAIARQFGTPYLVNTIGQLTPWALAQGELKKKIYSTVIERRNLNRAATIHCTSNGEAEDVSQFGIQTPKMVLPLGVTPPISIPDAKQKLRQQYQIPADVPIILFLSRLHPKKRPDLLLQTLEQLSLDYSFHLIMAGSGTPVYIKTLKDLAATLKLTSHTTFTGFVTGQDKDLLLQGSDLFVLPTYSENFGIVLAEAMVAGLPVITTAGTQIAPDIADAEAGLIVDGDSTALGAAISQLLQNPHQRTILGQNGQRFALNNYAWPAIAQNLATAYEAIVKQQPLPDCVLPTASSTKTIT